MVQTTYFGQNVYGQISDSDMPFRFIAVAQDLDYHFWLFYLQIQQVAAMDVYNVANISLTPPFEESCKQFEIK